MKETFKTIISDNLTQDLPIIWVRELKIPLKSNKIITLSGVRRSGKTYHLFNLIKKLKEKGIPRERIVYLNFEDERLNLQTHDLDLILQAYRELFPEQDLSKSYFFFDEIQEAPGWEKFVNRIYQTISKNIYITGSNSSLLSKEIATSLRGRTVTFEVYPLSFTEFVNIKKPNLNIATSKGKAKIASLFGQFLRRGGFPELLSEKKNIQEKTLQEYFNVMVLRDLIERFNITQTEILKYFCKRVVGNSANEFSVHKIFNEIKSQGYKTSKDTIYTYQGYVEAIYLSKFVPRYSPSVIKQAFSQKKTYVIDQAMGSAIDFKFSQDKGRILETTVALEFIKKGVQIAYTNNGTECDFLTLNKGEVENALQVCYNLSDKDTKDREIKGLIQTCKKFSLKKGTIISMEEEEKISLDGINVNITPAWKYFYNLSI